MTVIDRTTATKRVPMDSLRKTALIAGVIYLITFISIPTIALYSPVRNDPNYIVGPGPDTAVIFGGVLEIIVALACIGTAVVLYSVVKRQNEGVALGFVGARVLEAAAIFAGVVSLLSVVTAVGVFAGRLSDRQRLQALTHHRWNGRSRLPTRLPRRHRMTSTTGKSAARRAPLPLAHDNRRGTRLGPIPQGDHVAAGTCP
jgi:Domain of unknown function (DUF4386)